MKPMIIIPPETMSPEDIGLLRENGICVVVSANPAAVKFVDPIPAMSSRTTIEDAAIKLSRKLLAGELVGGDYRKNIATLYVDILSKGTPLDVNGTKEEQEARVFDSAKRDELVRLAREEAKLERAAAKVQKSNKANP